MEQLAILIMAGGVMEFFAMTQQHYHALIQAGETSSVAVVKALQDTMAEHPVFARVSGTR
ncbi:MAG: hypothetical protein OJF47_002662 [Nitrospira sp.]|jgi:hypothetical protein|nr:MAG: hypothetical protein OJF47_002662 [Nitrospira sp.]